MGKFKQPVHSRRSLLSKRKEWRATGSLKEIGGFRKLIMGAVPVFFLAFATAFVVASIFAPTQASDAASSNVTTISANINSSTYYIKLWTDPTVNIDLMAGPSAPMSVTRTQVKTFTNAPSGYKLYLGMTGASTGLVREGGSEAIASIGVLPSAAAALSTNTWGYAVQGDVPCTSGGVTCTTPAPWAGTHRTVGTTMAANSETFAGVPAYGSENNGLIQSTSTANGAGGTASEDEAAASSAYVYYAVRANSDMPSGRYTNTVAYTAIAEQSKDDGDFSMININPSSYKRPYRMEKMNSDGIAVGAATGDRLVIDTSIFTNMADLGTATVTLQGGPLTAGGAHAENTQQATYTCGNATVETVANLVRVSCDLPLVWAGEYQLVVSLPKLGMTAHKTYYSFVSWQTISAMQEMAFAEQSTPGTKKSVCDLATDPTDTGNLPFYRPVDVAAGTAGARTDGLNAANGTNVWTPSTSTTANSVPEIFLKDLRDYVFETNASRQAGTEGETGGGYIQAGYYRVRKLADGNCWMTENLDHPQQTGHYYYNWDTDLNSKTKWAPTANFIDGTVAGNPADLTIYIDNTSGWYLRDHSYYGRGCGNGWGTGGDGGSQTPCADSNAGGRYIATLDGETQKNGTYYHFQAATSGAGGAIEADNANSPDTFCPLGWQLPYSGTDGDYYDKSRSLNYLFTTYGIRFVDETQADATKVGSYPFSYVLSGAYYWAKGRLYLQNGGGYYWQSTNNNLPNSYLFHLGRNTVKPARADNKSFGYSIRCVTRY